MSAADNHPSDDNDNPVNADPAAAYEQPDLERPASSAPTEPELEQELPIGHEVRAPHDPYAALRNPNFLLFMGIWWVSVIGHQILSTALAWEIYDVTGSELLLGWVAGVQVIPLFLLALPAGHLADRVDRRGIIAVSAFGSGLCSLGLAFLSYREGMIPWMFALLIVASAFLVLGRPARSSLLPLILSPESFSNGVTWNASAFQISAVLGPALGGAVVAWSLGKFGSVSPAYFIDAVCAFALASLIFLVRLRRPDEDKTVDRSVLAGFRFVWRTKIILATMMLDLFAVLLGGATWLLPVFAKDILQVGPTGQGWLRAAEAIGAFSMSMLIAHLPPMKHAGRAMLLSVAGFGVATIVFGLSRNFWLSFAMLVLVGALDSVSVVVRHTLVQVLTPDSMRGRVAAVNNISIGASNELGGLESGLVAAFFGPVFSVVAGGIGTILVVLGIALKWPQVRTFGSLQDAKDYRGETEEDQRGFGVMSKKSTT